MVLKYIKDLKNLANHLYKEVSSKQVIYDQQPEKLIQHYENMPFFHEWQMLIKNLENIIEDIEIEIINASPTNITTRGYHNSKLTHLDLQDSMFPHHFYNLIMSEACMIDFGIDIHINFHNKTTFSRFTLSNRITFFPLSCHIATMEISVSYIPDMLSKVLSNTRIYPSLEEVISASKALTILFANINSLFYQTQWIVKGNFAIAILSVLSQQFIFTNLEKLVLENIYPDEDNNPDQNCKINITTDFFPQLKTLVFSREISGLSSISLNNITITRLEFIHAKLITPAKIQRVYLPKCTKIIDKESNPITIDTFSKYL